MLGRSFCGEPSERYCSSGVSRLVSWSDESLLDDKLDEILSSLSSKLGTIVVVRASWNKLKKNYDEVVIKTAKFSLQCLHLIQSK